MMERFTCFQLTNKFDGKNIVQKARKITIYMVDGIVIDSSCIESISPHKVQLAPFVIRKNENSSLIHEAVKAALEAQEEQSK